MTQINSDKSTWMRFFKDALIPSEFVAVYANKFVENRIRFDMLGDLDRALLNEMGISAIGDSLSILKHAKVIIQKISEQDTERPAAQSSNSQEAIAASQKRRGEVAKRIIETYLCDPDAKPLTEKGPLVKASGQQSMLSPELTSRLNFNPNLSNAAAYPKISVTFNDDSLSSTSSKVIVSSTTDDNGSGGGKIISLKKKRSISEVYDSQMPASKKLAKKMDKGGPPLEYRGLLKQSVSTSNVVSLKSPSQATTNPMLRANKPVQSRLSTAASSDSDRKLQGQITANLENIRIQVRNETLSGSKPTATAAAPPKESVFSRLNLSSKRTTESPADSTSSISTKSAATKPNAAAAAVRMLNNFGLKTKDSPVQPVKTVSTGSKLNSLAISSASEAGSKKSAITPITFSPDDFKPKISPITFDKPKQQTTPNARLASKPSLSSRLSR